MSAAPIPALGLGIPSSQTGTRPAVRRRHRYEKIGWLPFFLFHFVMFGALWSGVDWPAVWIFLVCYWGRMFAVTAGYHRYFSHRSFETSRWFQWVLAFAAVSSIQRGPLWWAAHHRTHHLYSDTEKDLHSPVVDEFFHSHLGWFFAGNSATDLSRVQDLAKYPELRWLDRYHLVPPAIVAFVIWLVWGWPALFFGFAASSVLVWHSTFLVNSLAHVWGSRRYQTKDQSRNNLFIALLTCGEGWHNNHHRCMNSARMGHRWWEIDLTFYGLAALEKVGLIWNLKKIPQRILDEGYAD